MRESTPVRVASSARNTRNEWLSRVLLLVLAGVSLTPLFALALTAARPSMRFPLLWNRDHVGLSGAAWSALASDGLWQSMGTSLLLAIATGLTASVLAYLAARTLVRASPLVRRLAAAAAFLPVIAPPIALGVGIQVLALRAGVGGTLSGVLLAHLVPATGYLTLFLLGVLGAYDVGMEEQARSLGASRGQVLFRVTLPALRPQLLVAVLLGALVSWGQVVLTLLVGGGVVRTLPVELLAYVRAGDDRLGAAAALLLTLPPAIALGALQLGARRTGAVS